MLIVCPKCDTTYRVDPAAYGPDGRQVRCARCLTTWRASADDPPPMAAATAPEAAEVTQAARRAADRSAPASAPPAVTPVVVAEAPSLVPAIEEEAGLPDAEPGIIEPLGEDIETLAARRERRHQVRKSGRLRWRPPRLSTVVVA